MNRPLRQWLQSLMIVEAFGGVLGLLLLFLQAAGAIRVSDVVLLSPFWLVGAIRGTWTAFTALLACSLVIQGLATRRDGWWARQATARQRLHRAEGHRRRKGRR